MTDAGISMVTDPKTISLGPITNVMEFSVTVEPLGPSV